MLQSLERARRDRHRTKATAAVPLRVTPPRIETHVKNDVGEQDDGLAATAGPVMMAAYAAVLIVAVLTFKSSREASLAVAISIFFGMVFFAVPLLMMHVRARHDARWHKAEAARRSDRVDTFTGPVGRSEAVLHMVIVPLVVCAAFTSFSVIWVLSKP